ncbi:amino acid adenylation domain-containing protein [Flavobacterium jejuense]|uniref:Amino acid adenylation domain-containing protein n=1 Tax=Flavobacterium jejuense TaxID=1544455 RepID=A0ABX0IQ14_9FLAO|nr:non-ribosomal peptide synthetase [Flavobacterium jejuense]NHN25907.1 amino acid adenylation domain-containing protein [Flavobacterium jejuense]
MDKLIYKLKQHDIKIKVVNQKLELTIPINFKDDWILNEVRENKEELTSYIINITREKSNFKEIEIADDKDYYVLSSAQRRLYFLYEFDKDSLAYNMPQTVKLEGKLDKNHLNNVFKQLISHYKILRTKFIIVNEEPVQQILTETNFELEYFNASEKDVQKIVKDFIRPFDLGKDLLIRVGLIELSDNEHILILDMHHIITDGVSNGILMKAFMTLYSNETLPNLHLQFNDYAEWQQSEEQQKEIVKQKQFWLNLFEEVPTVIELPTDFKRPIAKNYEGNILKLELSQNETKQLKLINERARSTMFMTILSIYYVLLNKISNQDDITIGTPIAGRQHVDLEELIGMFVNTLPLRNYPKGELSFIEFLENVKSVTLGCFENQSYQYESLLDDLKIERNTSRNPLFDTLFSYQNFEEPELSMPGLKLTSYNNGHTDSKFDISLTVVEDSEQLFLTFEYSTELFKKETIERFINYFKKIVLAVTEDINIKINEIGVLSKKEEIELIDDFNSSFRAYPAYSNIISLFESQVIQTPENIALRCSDSEMSYSELSHKINNFSDYLLKDKGVEVGEVIGVMLEREAYLIPTLFGILKSGGAYLPIDVTLPKDRIETIIKDSKISKLITRAEHLDSLESLSVEIIDLNQVLPSLIGRQSSGLQAKVNPNDLAYVIYTSGSTGTPKGVMIEHGSLLNIVQSMDNRYPLTATDSYLLKTTYSFDVSVAELFGWFHAGGSLTLLPSGSEKDPNKILSCIEQNKVTHVSFVPSMFSFFIETIEKEGIDKIRSLKYLFLAGEPLSIDLVNRFKALKTTITLENIYGPTEATIYSSGYSTSNLKEAEKVPIGKPLDNIHLYVLDQGNNLQPIGVPGELCIGGKALARGYLHNSELTAAKFIHVTGLPEERIYKTGDLVRWQQDGNIEYLGRIDNQVKIRGFRIELGDIESQLNKVQEVEQSAVVVKEKEGDKYLVAYYQSDKEIDQTELKQHLLDKLPEYMVPSYYVYLKEFPLTSSGKLSRKDLPEPEIKRGNNYKAPSNAIEEKLVAIWSEVLKLDKEVISVDRSFFELGGHSLKAMVLVNKIAKELEIELTVRKIFDMDKIESLSDYIITIKQIEISNKNQNKIIEITI